MQIKELMVKLITHPGPHSGTTDHIYIRVVGSRGGREFPLNTPGLGGFLAGTDVTYVLGRVAIPPEEQPFASTPGGENDPRRYPIELSAVEYVSIRKQGDRSISDDNAYRLNYVQVALIDSNMPPSKRIFEADLFNLDGQWLGNEFGHQLWLTEP